MEALQKAAAEEWILSLSGYYRRFIEVYSKSAWYITPTWFYQTIGHSSKGQIQYLKCSLEDNQHYYYITSSKSHFSYYSQLILYFDTHTISLSIYLSPILYFSNSSYHNYIMAEANREYP